MSISATVPRPNAVHKMEDVYTIKVKTKPDTRNLYPSERRYSASTVSGLAWVHIALSATSFLLACLALVNPDEGKQPNNTTESLNSINGTANSSFVADNGYMLVLAPSLLSVFGLAAGVASIMASVKWYIDHNITWLFIASVMSTVVSLASFVMVAVWFASTSEGEITDFYKDKVPFKDFVVVRQADVYEHNSSHVIVALNSTKVSEESQGSRVFTTGVLSINILIAAFLEVLWSILSVKISYRGMRNNYKDDSSEPRGKCISVVTKIKGNDPKHIPRNGKLLKPKPDLIEHYPNKKIKKIYLAQDENGFYLKNQNNKVKQNTETSSEIYKERMMNFLNRCASLEGVSNPEATPSVHSDALNTIPEVASAEINLENERKATTSPLSWGDTPDHTVYNQNTLNLENIFNFTKKVDAKNEEPSENDNL